MKANEFVNKFGLEKAKNITVFSLGFEGDCSDFNFTIGDLKRLVESHDFVDLWGGIGLCKFYMMGMKLNECDSVKCPKTGMITSKTKLEQVIADVESCL